MTDPRSHEMDSRPGMRLRELQDRQESILRIMQATYQPIIEKGSGALERNPELIIVCPKILPRNLMSVWQNPDLS